MIQLKRPRERSLLPTCVLPFSAVVPPAFVNKYLLYVCTDICTDRASFYAISGPIFLRPAECICVGVCRFCKQVIV